MRIYKIKIPSDALIKFAAFCAAFKIRVILSVTTETLFGYDAVIYCTDEESEGITSSEKERLLTERYANNILSIYYANPDGSAQKL